MDGDNTMKCLLDALVDNKVLPDDSRQYVRSVGMEWIEGKEGATAYISPAGLPTHLEVSGAIS
jgi:hypothetical protein